MAWVRKLPSSTPCKSSPTKCNFCLGKGKSNDWLLQVSYLYHVHLQPEHVPFKHEVRISNVTWYYMHAWVENFTTGGRYKWHLSLPEVARNFILHTFPEGTITLTTCKSTGRAAVTLKEAEKSLEEPASFRTTNTTFWSNLRFPWGFLQCNKYTRWITVTPTKSKWGFPSNTGILTLWMQPNLPCFVVEIKSVTAFHKLTYSTEQGSQPHTVTLTKQTTWKNFPSPSL